MDDLWIGRSDNTENSQIDLGKKVGGVRVHGIPMVCNARASWGQPVNGELSTPENNRRLLVGGKQTTNWRDTDIVMRHLFGVMTARTKLKGTSDLDSVPIHHIKAIAATND